MREKEIFKGNPLPKKKYTVIYADPSWDYRDKALAGKRGASCKYPTLTIDELCQLPVKDITKENAFLFLWTTFPLLEECFEVIKAWGFIYKTIGFVWIKTNKLNGQLFTGMGNYTRSNAEICLLATKGKVKRINAAVHSVIISPIQIHSKKPNETRRRIVSLVGDVSRIELFSRHKIAGWDCWGNEVFEEKMLENFLADFLEVKT